MRRRPSVIQMDHQGNLWKVFHKRGPEYVVEKHYLSGIVSPTGRLIRWTDGVGWVGLFHAPDLLRYRSLARALAAFKAEVERCEQAGRVSP